MIQETKASILNNSEELLPMAEWDFPYLCMHANLKKFNKGVIGWHWHGVFEIDYIDKGEITFHTLDSEIHLHTGCAIFFNYNSMHMLKAVNPIQENEVFAHFFDGKILASGIGNNAEQRYINRIKENSEFNALCLYPENKQDCELLRLVKQVRDLCREEIYGYEMLIRGLLCKFWILLLERNTSILANDTQTRRGKNDELRLRQMIMFIQSHYHEKILLKDIANVVNISTRECSRCFKRSIEISPMEYLKEYRLEQAAARLAHKRETITEIAEICGFFSNSYFSQCFYNKYGCTPRDFRNKTIW